MEEKPGHCEHTAMTMESEEAELSSSSEDEE